MASIWAQIRGDNEPAPAPIGPDVWAALNKAEPSPQLVTVAPGTDTQKAGIDLHHGLTPIFAPTPKVSLDPNKAHQVEGALANDPTGQQMIQNRNIGKLAGDYEKDVQKPQSVWGKIGHGLLTAANIAGTIAAPQVMGAIPGTDLYRHNEEKRLVKEIGDQENSQSINAYRGAEKAKTEATTPTAEEKQAGLEHTKAETGNLESETMERAQSAKNPALALGYAHAVNRAIEEGRDPATDPIVQHLADAITTIQKQPVTHEDTPEQATYKDLIKQGKTPEQAYEQIRTRPTVMTPAANSARSDKSFQYNQGELDKLSNPVGQLVQRVGRLMDTFNADSTAAMSLVAPEMLTIMAGGQGSGLRMNEAEISRIVGGRSKWEALKGNLQQWSADPKHASPLPPEQVRQMRDLIQTVNAKLVKKEQVLNDAAGHLIDTDDPKEHRRIVQQARQGLESIDSGGEASKSEWKPPSDAPEAPKQDGKVLKVDGQIVAKSQGGRWVQP